MNREPGSRRSSNRHLADEAGSERPGWTGGRLARAIAPRLPGGIILAKREVITVIRRRLLKGQCPMQALACLNGEIMPVEQARVSVWDRGFLFGDAVYEVFRMYQGRCWLEAEHLARLKRSLKELEFAAHDLAGMMERVYETVAGAGSRRGRFTSRSPEAWRPRSHPFPDPPVPPTEVIIVRPYDDGPTARLRRRACR